MIPKAAEEEFKIPFALLLEDTWPFKDFATGAQSTVSAAPRQAILKSDPCKSHCDISYLVQELEVFVSSFQLSANTITLSVATATCSDRAKYWNSRANCSMKLAPTADRLGCTVNMRWHLSGCWRLWICSWKHVWACSCRCSVVSRKPFSTGTAVKEETDKVSSCCKPAWKNPQIKDRMQNAAVQRNSIVLYLECTILCFKL